MSKSNMSIRLSRRKLSTYYATELLDGADPQKLTEKLAAFLIESKRTKEVQLIIDDIEYQLSLRGVVTADVTSAHVLDKLTKQSITNLIQKTTNAKQIQLTEHLDESLLGGIKLEFADSELDTTIVRRLNTLKTNCKEL